MAIVQITTNNWTQGDPYFGPGQPGKIGNAVRVLDDDLAIEMQPVDVQRLHTLCDGREALRPVEPGSRQEADLAGVDARLDAIAVELDLMAPLRAGRRPIG